MRNLSSYGILIEVRYQYIHHFQTIWTRYYCSAEIEDEERQRVEEQITNLNRNARVEEDDSKGVRIPS